MKPGPKTKREQLERRYVALVLELGTTRAAELLQQLRALLLQVR